MSEQSQDLDATRISSLLADPIVGISLDRLKIELNELAKVRYQTRLAFSKRIALVYMLIVGRRIDRSNRASNATQRPFFQWCRDNLRNSSGKPYTVGSLRQCLYVGFSASPELTIKKHAGYQSDSANEARRIGVALKQAVRTAAPPQVVPIDRLRKEHHLPTNVAQEVNALMTAWERASSQARSQFIYMVTGKRVAA